jgi:acetyl-CoA carboxylase carboxyltransferase component
VSDDETLGGARMHAEVSGLGDLLAEDELDAIRMCREVISHLNWRKEGPGPSFVAEPPVHDPEELLGLVSRDLRQPVDVRDVIARVVDGSRFEELKAGYGPTMVCGWASLHGYPVGILGNNGVIYPDARRRRPTSSSCATRWTSRSSSCRTSPATWWDATSRPTGSSRRARRCSTR